MSPSRRIGSSPVGRRFYEASLRSSEWVGRQHSVSATSLNGLAGLYLSEGRLAEAEPLYKRSLSIREKSLGGDHPDVATSLYNLALLYWHQGRLAEAEPLYERSLAIRESRSEVTIVTWQIRSPTWQDCAGGRGARPRQPSSNSGRGRSGRDTRNAIAGPDPRSKERAGRPRTQ
jgi:tetratricopeptide (TPR) repeat protein